MIQYLRHYPATYKKFCGWAYQTYRYLPTYLEFNKPEMTFGLLAEFFGLSPVVPQGLSTSEQLYEFAKNALVKYEAQIATPEDKVTVIRKVQTPEQIQEEMYLELEEMGLWPPRDDCPF